MVEIFFHLASKRSKWCAQTLHPFCQIFQFYSAIRAPIVAPPSDNFQNCSIGWKVLFFRKKRCKRHLNRPTNVDAMSSGSKSTTHQSSRRPRSVTNKNKTRNKSNDYFESMWYRHYTLSQQKKSCLPIHVAQKIIVIRAQKSGKFAVWYLTLCTGAIWRRAEKFEHRCTTTYHPL